MRSATQSAFWVWSCARSFWAPARNWKPRSGTIYECSILSQIAPPRTTLDPARLGDPDCALPATPFMEAHYFSHACFLKDAPLLENSPRLAGIPGIIVQARHDLLCPPATSHRLAARWPDAEIRIVEQAGHSLGDGETMAAMQRAIAEMIARVAR